MSLKELAIIILATLVTLILIVSVVGLIVISVFGNVIGGGDPTPVPTKVPDVTNYPVPTGYPTSSPTGTPNNGGTQYPPYPTVPVNNGNGTTPSPTVHPVTSAQLVDYGTNSDTFKAGDLATGYIVIKNTGNTVINDVDMTVTAARTLPFIGEVKQSQDVSVHDQNIQPGETKRIEYSILIPATYSGISTAGDYKITVVVKVAGVQIGSFTKQVKIVA
jgi:hypothetical protein